MLVTRARYGRNAQQFPAQFATTERKRCHQFRQTSGKNTTLSLTSKGPRFIIGPERPKSFWPSSRIKTPLSRLSVRPHRIVFNPNQPIPCLHNSLIPESMFGKFPSGVHTIMGVSTSVTAFIGKAQLGPIDEAVRVLSFAESTERRFGGLLPDATEMSYAVRQFFCQRRQRGAWIVPRGGRGPNRHPRRERCQLGGRPAASLRLTRPRQGGGRQHDLRRHRLRDLAARQHVQPDRQLLAGINAPAAARTETFPNLSLNSRGPPIRGDRRRAESSLIKAERIANVGAVTGKGTSLGAEITDTPGGTLLDVATLLDNNHNELRIQSGSSPPVKVVLNPATDATWAPTRRRAWSRCARPLRQRRRRRVRTAPPTARQAG